MSIEDIAIYAIGTIILVGSWIANILKKQADQRAERERQLRQTAEGPEERVRVDLDQLSARRREQLRQVARERMEARSQQTGQRVAMGGEGEPTNLTMAERIARARAKAQYEARMRGLQTGDVAAEADEEEVNQREQARRAEAERERRAAEARARQEAAERAREEAARRARQQRQRQAQQQAQQQSQREAARRALEAQRREQAEARREREEARVAATRAKRGRTTETPSPYTRTQSLHPVHAWLSGRSLRDAIVLKEILDRPVALRDPMDERI